MADGKSRALRVMWVCTNELLGRQCVKWNFSARSIFSGIGFFNEPEILDLRPTV